MLFITRALRLAVLITILWVIIWHVKGDRVAYLGYVNAAGFGFFLLMTVTFVLFILQRLWIDAAIASVIGFWLLIGSSGLNFTAGENAKPNNSIRILSASLRGANKDMRSAAAKLSNYEPELLALQEISDPIAFKKALETNSGKKWNMVNGNNLAILTTHKISKALREYRGWLAIEAQIDGKPMTFWTVRAPKAFDQPVENSMFYRKVLNAISEEKPDVVLGDFNASPWNEGYDIMSAHMQDAHKTAGFGFGNTFPAPARRSGSLGALTRIDHIFVENSIVVRNAFTGTASSGADHHPVVADIVMPQ